tara:strand:- start:361 stop:645 length:285 start_codon:yes stop_codon:yes gene_type:complete
MNIMQRHDKQPSVDLIEEGGEFLSTPRGRYIVAKALFFGVKALSKVRGADKEVSDLSDMLFLANSIFRFPVELEYQVDGEVERVYIDPEVVAPI